MPPKQHYIILDGLRGVVALLVVVYHVFEAFAFSAGAPYQHMYHGFLGVDFFFILSGFVLSYAYDDRWSQMSLWDFYGRRLRRLHPIVLLAAVLGLVVFQVQGGFRWDGSHPRAWMVAGSFILTMVLLPCPSTYDLRGNGEAFSLNGPLWSLFFEYLASIFYAHFLRHLSDRKLAAVCILNLFALILLSVFYSPGSIGLGWSSDSLNLLGGLFRMMFAFPLGMLLCRWLHTERFVRQFSHGFLWAALLLVLLLSVPAIAPCGHISIFAETLYQVLVVALFFPLVIWIGAQPSPRPLSKAGCRCLSFLGRMSYPLYALHYPFIYLLIDYLMKQ